MTVFGTAADPLAVADQQIAKFAARIQFVQHTVGEIRPRDELKAHAVPGLFFEFLTQFNQCVGRVPCGPAQRQVFGQIDGVVDVEHDPVGHAGIAVAEGVDHPQPHAREHPPAHRILQPGESRLRGQPDIRVRALVAGDPQRRVMAQNIEVVAVLMPAGDGDHSRLDHGLV